MGGAVMYGGFPTETSPRIAPWITPGDVADVPPFTPYIGTLSPMIPATPVTKDSIVRDLIMRIDELRTTIAYLEPMREELATLERMLAATKLEPVDGK